MPEVIGIIPARSGSKSIIDKNIILLNGHPLIAYSIAAAKLSNNIDLNISYEGRKTGDASTVHIARAQVKATF